jgi:DNA (cytosine-5)-methyltransferase 1
VPALWKDLSKITDYPAYLDAAWAEHLAERQPDAPTVISTFAGCGGSSLGYSMAGFRELLAVEWDDNAVQTFRLNFPDVPVYHGDIAKITVEQVLEMTGLAPGELDVFDGSPPCQGFSTAGKREMTDSRNQLFREYVRLLRGLQPKVFVMENVSGMVKGKMKLIFAEILRELKASGYRVSARLLNAMYFGVPQSRERMIFIGVREDLGIEPTHPGAETQPVNITQAFVNVENSQLDIQESKYPETTMSYRLLAQMKQWEGGHQYHPNGAMFGLRRLAWSKPSRTVLREDGGGASCQCCHPEENRRLTIPEIKRVASYPDVYKCVGKVGERWARIGNSVPPLFMRSIARHIRAHILATAFPGLDIRRVE